MKYPKKTILFYSTAVALLLGGCMQQPYDSKTNAEVLSSSSQIVEELKTHSLMQQLMDVSSRSKNKIVFSVNTSDRYVSTLSEGNLFEMLASLPNDARNAIAIQSETTLVKKISIRPEEQIPNGLWLNTKEFSARKLVHNLQSNNGIKLSIPAEISNKVTMLAVEFDANSKVHGENANLLGFISALSSSFAAENTKLYYSFDKSNKVLFLSTKETSFESTPSRIFTFKKTLGAQGIKFKTIGDNELAIEGSFSDWIKAYNIAEELDPYRAQVYRITSSSGSVMINEGYENNRVFNIEFQGWDRDGMRVYLFYNNKNVRKIITRERSVNFADGGEKITIDLY